MTIERAYVQKKDGEFINDTAYIFWYGCQKLGIWTVPFTVEEIGSIELTPDTLVHGHIGPVRKAFTRLGVQQPSIDEGPPEELRPLFGRRMWRTTMAEVQRLGSKRIFIKPFTQQKAFTGFVTSGEIRDLIRTAQFPDDFEILASEVVNFVVEYRLFIHHGLIVGCRHYLGDFTKLIDFDVALACVRAYESAPCAYSLDMGLTDDGRTLPVEVNDAFSLGAYGLPAITYAQLVIDRWEEIMKGKG